MSGKAMFLGLENLFKGAEKALPKLPDEVQAGNKFWADIKRLLTKSLGEKDTVTFTQHTRGRTLKRVGSQDTLVNSPIDEKVFKSRTRSSSVDSSWSGKTAVDSPIDEQVFRGRSRSNSIDSSWSGDTLIEAPIGKQKNLFHKFFGKSAEKSAIKAEIKAQREELKALEKLHGETQGVAEARKSFREMERTLKQDNLSYYTESKNNFSKQVDMLKGVSPEVQAHSINPRDGSRLYHYGQPGIDVPKRNLPPIKSNMSSITIKQEALRRLNFINAQKAELNTLKREIGPFYGQGKSLKSMEIAKSKIQKSQVEAEAILREMDNNLACKDMLAHDRRQKNLERKLFKINYNLDKLKYLETANKNMDALSVRLEDVLEQLNLTDSGIAMKRKAVESKNRVYSALHTRMNVNEPQKEHIQEHMTTVKNVVQEFEDIILSSGKPRYVENLTSWEARDRYYY